MAGKQKMELAAVNTAAALKKEKHLEELLHSFRNVTVAFSGGVDSAYLLGRAVQVLGREQVQAVTLKSALNPPGEVEEAASFALKLAVRHRVMNIDISAERELMANTSERCYVCKRSCFGRLSEVSAAGGFQAVLDGSNADDLNDYRPGMRAAEELGIRSPLLEASLGKDEIRLLSKMRGYATWDKPSAACLASRIPYGQEITPEKLKKVADAECFLRQVGVKTDLRVRFHDNLARIEINSSDLDCVMRYRKEIAARLQVIGFTYVTLDLDGFESGSLNR